MKSTKTQRRDIHILCDALGIDDEMRRDQMKECFGVRSTTELSYADAMTYVTLLEHKAEDMKLEVKRPPLRFDHLGNRPGMATPRQMRMMEVLWAQVSKYSNREERERAFRSFLFNRFQRSDITMIEQPLVRKVVQALRAMDKQSKKEAE